MDFRAIYFCIFNRSKDGSVMTYVKHNFTTSPELWITKDNFKTQKCVTDINPQQRDYNWGTNELVNWKSATGLDLQGILHKRKILTQPEVPNGGLFLRKSIRLSKYYRAPAPSKSTININILYQQWLLSIYP